MATETARPAPTVLAPGITSTPGVQGGEPVIAGTRVATDAVYGWWRYPGRDAPWAFLPYGSMLGAIASHLRLGRWEQVQAAVCFEAGRRYEREQQRRDKRRRWVGTVNDADAHRERGRQEGLAEACAYLRQCGRDEWAAGLEAALAAKEGE